MTEYLLVLAASFLTWGTAGGLLMAWSGTQRPLWLYAIRVGVFAGNTWTILSYQASHGWLS